LFFGYRLGGNGAATVKPAASSSHADKTPASVAILSGRLELHDVDVESLALWVISRSGLELNWSDREDLLETLVVACWECSDDYDPGRGAFSTFATIKLRSAVTAWLRTSNERCGRTGFVGGRTIWRFGDGRVHERPQRVLVSFDGADRDQLVNALSEGRGDREADRDEAVGGLFATRDSERARDFYEMGLEPRRRAA
jgi:DNA-directed RNA polymerase specialized sigma24 family protein